ncbi:hypothetical protein [Niallia sp. NCCP-28]|uniref:hypothetical protein n=1 Tax=Niallia sp. NCCP-28 TaxID=2934712 RepID=UPI002080B13E|nr:hypothetical protein [Niallia sp. NCCP-28]GKU80894.1 hypothetical protein NCCP28_02900 [Niallia sp. NCCP-28]
MRILFRNSSSNELRREIEQVTAVLSSSFFIFIDLFLITMIFSFFAGVYYHSFWIGLIVNLTSFLLFAALYYLLQKCFKEPSD